MFYQKKWTLNVRRRYMCNRKSHAEMAKTEATLHCWIGKREYREFIVKMHVFITCNWKQTIIKMSNILLCISFPFGSVLWGSLFGRMATYVPFFLFHSILSDIQDHLRRIFEFSVFNIEFFGIERVHLPSLIEQTDWLNSFWLTAWTPKIKWHTLHIRLKQ